MAEFPAMPFWFDAYYRDTQHLTYEEHGIYLHLIKLLWHAPAQRIPHDVTWMCRRFNKHTPKAFALIEEFCQVEDGWVTQNKIRREFQHLAESREKQREKAKLRWDKEKGTCNGTAVGYAAGYAADMPPTPTPTEERKKERLSNGGAGVESGEAKKRPPRHRQKTKDGKRFFLHKGTEEFNQYAAQYYEKHRASVVLLWGGTGAWFNILGET